MSTFNESDVRRQKAGQPTGGQFAEKERAASGVALAAPRSVTPSEFWDAENAAWRAQQDLWGVGEKSAALELHRVFVESGAQRHIEIGEGYLPGEVHPRPHIVAIDDDRDVPERYVLAVAHLDEVTLSSAGADVDWAAPVDKRKSHWVRREVVAKKAKWAVYEDETLDEACERTRARYAELQDDLLRARVHQNLCDAALAYHPDTAGFVVRANDDGDAMQVVGLVDGDGNRLDVRDNPAAVRYVEQSAGNQEDEGNSTSLAQLGDASRWARAGLLDPDDVEPGREHVVTLDRVREVRGYEG